MAHIQRRGGVGIGVEASGTPGTAVSPAYWLQVAGDPTINDKFEFENIETARGRVEKSQGQKVMKKKGEGSIELIMDEIVSPILFGLILGSNVDASAGGGLHTHTSTINNTNTPKTATLVLDRVVDVRQFTYTVLTGLELNVGDGFATMKLDFVSKESASGTASESYSTVTNFSFKELTAKFGTDVSAANSASATPLSGVKLSIKREAEPIYQSGSTTPNKFVYKTLETSGNYSLLFESVTDRDKYLNETANAMILTFTDVDGNIVKITLSRVLINNWEPNNSLNDIVAQTAEFIAHYDATQTESIRVVVTNDVASYTNLA